MKKFVSVLIAVVCAFSFVACAGGNGDTHTTHNWSATYTPDGEQHYQTCDGCDEKQYSDHDYDADGVCVCGKTKPTAQHTSHNWSKTYTPTPDGDRHYQTCDGCDEKQYSDHDYGDGDTCVCGKKKPTVNVPAESVTLDESKLELELGGSGAKLTATVLPENATDKSVTYTVEPQGVVDVDNDGNVTVIDEGEAVITATTANDKKATCNVTVSKALTNADVLEFLNENYLIAAAKNIFPPSWAVNESNVVNPTWYITLDDSKITSANLLFTYLRAEDSNYLNLYQVNFNLPLTLQDIRESKIVTLTCTRIYQIIIDPQIQEQRADLTNAICDLLFGTKESAARYIIDKGNDSLDPKLGNSKMFSVIEVTNSGVQEKSIKIAYASTDEGLINSLSDKSKYYTYGNDISHVITGTKLENNSNKF